MPGLIKNQMPAPPAAAQAAPGAPQDQGADESNPEFITAMKLAMQALYADKAAKDVAKQLQSDPDKVHALADISYEMTSVVDERTGGKVPRELIALLAMAILNEVVSIAEAAKVDVQPADAAGAFKQMLLRYLGEQGVDTTQLQQSMDQIDPAVFSKGA
jgi:hypothetical protein